MFAHLSLSAALSVYVCVRHPLGPTPAPPPASRALCRAPSHPSPGPRCVTSKEAQRRGTQGRSPTTRPQAALDAGWDLLVGRGANTTRGRYSPASRKGDRKSWAARAFRWSSRLAHGQLAAGGKGRGPARPLTHPVRAGQEESRPSRRQRPREPIRRSRGKGRAEGASRRAIEQITLRCAASGLARGGEAAWA